ncbi:MAG: hypothetical protein ACM31C_27130 [Acidobacteriota bacterium]
MSARDPKVHVLVIRSWIEDLRPIRQALAAAGIRADLTTADFEASLNAALTRGGYAVAIYDPRTPGLSRETVLACFRANKRDIPLIVLEDIASLAERVVAALASHVN